jgi:multiple sugar transport system substrate-binding protein
VPNRRLTGSVALLLAAGALAACSGSGSGSSPSPSDSGAAVTGKVTLWHLEDPKPDWLNAVKKGFEAKYPGTTVDLVEVPEDGYVTKVDTAMLANKPPDVGFIYEPRWMKAGSILDLTSTIAQYNVPVNDFNKVAMSPCEMDGKVYCLGSLTGSVVLLYNKDLFDKAKVAYPPADRPMTIDEYAEKSRAITAALKDVKGSVAGAPITWASRANTYSADGKTIEGYVNDAPTMHAYEVLAKMCEDGVSPLPADTELVQPADMLGAGTVAMAVTDYEYAANALEKAGYKWGAAPPPVEQATDPTWVFVGTDQYGAFTKAANPTAAKALVAYIGNEGNQLRVDVADQPPLNQTLLGQWAKEDVSRKEVVAVLNTSTAPGLFVPGFWELAAPLMDQFSQMADGGAKASALNEEAPALQDKLNKEWETWNGIK